MLISKHQFAGGEEDIRDILCLPDSSTKGTSVSVSRDFLSDVIPAALNETLSL